MSAYQRDRRRANFHDGSLLQKRRGHALGWLGSSFFAQNRRKLSLFDSTMRALDAKTKSKNRRMPRFVVACSALVGLLACGVNRSTPPISGMSTKTENTTDGAADPFTFDHWESSTWSPRVTEVPESLVWLQSRCGKPDSALQSVAQRLARDTGFGTRPDDLDRLAFALRASGSPYVWPRAWRMPLNHDFTEEEVVSHFDNWMRSFDDGGERRCGLARIRTQSGVTYAAVASDVVADLVEPLPTRARTGQWLSLRVKLLQEATEAKVVVEGTRNEPAFIPASVIDGEVLARFPVMGPGPWLVQVLATMNTGPRPVIDAELVADEMPPKTLRSQRAPGESASSQGQDLAESLLAMLNAARAEVGRKPLVQDARLNRVATEHAMAMLAAGRVGHDVGDGSPRSRMENAGIFAALAGENVAHAADTVRTHRALWASPSHRSNILHRGFRNVGLGVVRGPDDTVWTCELFAALD